MPYPGNRSNRRPPLTTLSLSRPPLRKRVHKTQQRHRHQQQRRACLWTCIILSLVLVLVTWYMVVARQLVLFTALQNHERNDPWARLVEKRRFDRHQQQQQREQHLQQLVAAANETPQHASLRSPPQPQQPWKEQVTQQMQELQHVRHEQEQVIAVQRFATTNQSTTTASTEIPFVVMVFDRVDYFQALVESLRASDFPRDRVPLIVSHDGRVPVMVEYVASLQTSGDFPHLQAMVHPHSCYEHPHSFPGNDTKLNQGYPGDSYGNPRSAWSTCCKHHFTWMLNQVFTRSEWQDYDTFFFLEEDYLVARSIYASLQTGIKVMARTESETTNGYFGLAMNATTSAPSASSASAGGEFVWSAQAFRTGPMTLNRAIWRLLQSHAQEYCQEYDEYNWDWTLYHLMRDQLLPFTVLVPFHVPLVQHIGARGMHTIHASEMDLVQRQFQVSTPAQVSHNHWDAFLSAHWMATNGTRGKLALPTPRYHKPSGGWNHPADQEHCQALF